MFDKVLVANRGVVTARVARTLKRMGIKWVAVYSEAEAELAYVSDADEAYCIGPAAARESYLNYDALLDAIRRSGCDAVHPGYGFLSEDPAFARQVEEAGARFIGPRPEHIEAMGNKVRAREHMEVSGVPVLRASGPVPENHTDFAGHMEHIGFPMMVKAAAGGGGIGMERVQDGGALAAAVEKTRQLSSRVFGDGTVYLERYLEEPRHVEFQMIGDQQGRVRAVYERDCSIQRRHQKVIEETPAPEVDRAACDAMAERLVQTLAGWGYESLGTVEMLMDGEGGFSFLEMNTRLQVEHSVTEAVTGLDLVEQQIAVAAGKQMNEACPADIPRDGHAIELRIYAEDPVRFLPSTGQLTTFRPPEMDGIRVETAIGEGNAVTPHYDPMLALVIARGSDRLDAMKRAHAALDAFAVEGVKTNIPFLRHVLASEEFRESRHHTTIGERLSKSVA
jgi:acetyl-CoA carboxylase biotin carboxylase subunit